MHKYLPPGSPERSAMINYIFSNPIHKRIYIRGYNEQMAALIVPHLKKVKSKNTGIVIKLKYYDKISNKKSD